MHRTLAVPADPLRAEAYAKWLLLPRVAEPTEEFAAPDLDDSRWLKLSFTTIEWQAAVG